MTEPVEVEQEKIETESPTEGNAHKKSPNRMIQAFENIIIID